MAGHDRRSVKSATPNTRLRSRAVDNDKRSAPRSTAATTITDTPTFSTKTRTPTASTTKPSTRWTREERLVLHILNGRLAGNPDGRHAVFNRVFRDLHRRMGLRTGREKNQLRMQYSDRSKADRQASWAAILRGPGNRSEREERRKWEGRVVKVAREVGVDIGEAAKGRGGRGKKSAADVQEEEEGEEQEDGNDGKGPGQASGREEGDDTSEMTEFESMKGVDVAGEGADVLEQGESVMVEDALEDDGLREMEEGPDPSQNFGDMDLVDSPLEEEPDYHGEQDRDRIHPVQANLHINQTGPSSSFFIPSIRTTTATYTETPLLMIHYASVEWAGNQAYFTLNETPNHNLVPRDSPTYLQGGKVHRVLDIANNAADVMICNPELCAECALPNTATPTTSSVPAVAENVSPTDGYPFVHTIDVKKIGNRFAFAPDPFAGFDRHFSAITESFPRNVVYGDGVMRITECCLPDKCKVCCWRTGISNQTIE